MFRRNWFIQCVLWIDLSLELFVDHPARTSIVTLVSISYGTVQANKNPFSRKKIECKIKISEWSHLYVEHKLTKGRMAKITTSQNVIQKIINNFKWKEKETNYQYANDKWRKMICIRSVHPSRFDLNNWIIWTL